jgi:hypothetical protein
MEGELEAERQLELAARRAAGRWPAELGREVAAVRQPDVAG